MCGRCPSARRPRGKGGTTVYVHNSCPPRPGASFPPCHPPRPAPQPHHPSPPPAPPQARVFAPAPSGVRRCIVATNIAETSVTGGARLGRLVQFHAARRGWAGAGSGRAGRFERSRAPHAPCPGCTCNAGTSVMWPQTRLSPPSYALVDMVWLTSANVSSLPMAPVDGVVYVVDASLH